MTKTLTAADRIAARWIPKTATPVLEHENGSALYVYMAGARFALIAFWGTSQRAHQHFTYRTEQARNEAIWSWRAAVEHAVTSKVARAASRKAEPCTLVAGDIVNTSWGYDQTNVEFYVVTRVSGTRVYLQPIAADYEATGYMSGKTWPAMPIRTTGPEFWAVGRGKHCRINGHSASLTTGDTYTSSYA